MRDFPFLVLVVYLSIYYKYILLLTLSFKVKTKLFFSIYHMIYPVIAEFACFVSETNYKLAWFNQNNIPN